MTTAPSLDWKEEFGIGGLRPPEFFARKEDIGAGAPHAHALRRAFESMGLDGVLCLKGPVTSPLIYFKQVERIEPADVQELHRQFWNQGIAPILVLIAPDKVHVYSGLARPVADMKGGQDQPGLVEELSRVTRELRAFLVAVSSGEFFRKRANRFDPGSRVDRELLRDLKETRKQLAEVESSQPAPQQLDALLCRLVFTCYLFDRGIIGPAYLEPLKIKNARHLRDILGRESWLKSREELYRLFKKLGNDFNGDLFSGDLDKELEQLTEDHLKIIDGFFHGRIGQYSFWPYNFGFIPIETISAIYEHFLKVADPDEKKKKGAFYTPRFLAEIVLDLALEGHTTLLDKRFLDPACGSGIFLVGLFNRLAEEWTRCNPNASYEQRAKGLLEILCCNLAGVDVKATACRITAFSLYLAFLDQLSPPDIQRLLKWVEGAGNKVLPPLIQTDIAPQSPATRRPLRVADFFDVEAGALDDFNVVVGNPPWGSEGDESARMVTWCSEQDPPLPLPDRQMAAAFVWKAVRHLMPGGKVCFVLPHDVLFNHSPTALDFQRTWIRRHAIELVLNLMDYQRFLFVESEAPAVVVRYLPEPPKDSRHRIRYLIPKADWSITQGDIISVLPDDQTQVPIREVLEDLQGPDAPLIWKKQFWATPRDRRLLERLSMLPRLREVVGQPRTGKRWLMTEGIQPLGERDDPDKAKTLELPTRYFIDASSSALELFLLPEDCEERPDQVVKLRGKSNTNIDIFRAPHVLVGKGLKSAFAGFDVVFRHAVRGIHGPRRDRALLSFLAAYLNSKLARFYLFHTSNWGVSRGEVHVEELVRLPFPLPEEHESPGAGEIVRKVADIIASASREARSHPFRSQVVQKAREAVEPLVEEYFDIDAIEKELIEDTIKVTMPSVRPNRPGQKEEKDLIPSLRLSSPAQRERYMQRLCEMLNDWAQGGQYEVHGYQVPSEAAGVGMVVLEKGLRGRAPVQRGPELRDVLMALNDLQRTIAGKASTLEIVRGVKVFQRNRLFIVKPLSQRFWTNTAALNDADEIAAAILMRSTREGV